MNKPWVFISCGQRTPEEKLLGAQICEMVASTTLFRPFFAETQNNLNGLHDNIMQALTDAVGFIAVMHSRGDVFVDGRTDRLITRASVWVEQEIAIAAYIDRQRKRRLLTAVYCHESVGREGMRDLLHLNPESFSTHDQVIESLHHRLSGWKMNESIDDDGELYLRATPTYSALGRSVALSAHFRNDGERADQYSCVMYVPNLLMKNMGMQFLAVPHTDPRYIKLVFTETHRNNQPLLHDTTIDFMSVEASIAELNPEERATLEQTPILLNAQIGSRRYKVEVAICEAFGTGAQGIS